MRNLSYALLPAVVCCLLPPAAQAQMVEVGPGYVRAPFVRVYSYPGGGSYVRAPFVSRYTPGFPRRYQRESASASLRFDGLSWGELARLIRESRGRLDAELERFPSADFWRTSLKTAEIAELVAVDRDEPPTNATRYRLIEILATYKSIGATPDFNRVAQLASFQTLRGALGEYVLLPEQRLRRQLASIAGDLNEAVGRFDTGATWQEYLLVGPNLPLSESRLRAIDAVSPAELSDVLARFDSISDNPDFGMISGLPAFKSMHELLARYFAERQIPSASPMEELPAPAPRGSSSF